MPLLRHPLSAMVDLDDLETALRVLYRTASPTRRQAWALVSARAGAELWVKHNNQLPTGAVKLGSGIALLPRLANRVSKPSSPVSATRGKHSQSLAFAGSRFGMPLTIVVLEGDATEKTAASR